MSYHPVIEKAANEKFAVGLYYYPPDVTDDNPIDTAEASVSPEGLTLVGVPVIVGQRVTQMISGGTSGVTYAIQFTVTLQDTSVYESPNFDALTIRVL